MVMLFTLIPFIFRPSLFETALPLPSVATPVALRARDHEGWKCWRGCGIRRGHHPERGAGILQLRCGLKASIGGMPGEVLAASHLARRSPQCRVLNFRGDTV